MAIMTLSEFRNVTHALVERLPKDLFTNLNGGITVQPNRAGDARNDRLTLGEYIEDAVMSRSIVLYYGSFRELFRDDSLSVWSEEIEETVLHELRHHVEALAGLDDLSREEELDPDAY